MRNQLAFTVLFIAANSAFAETPKPNSLTAKEIADGWIMLFDGETSFGWTAQGNVTVAKSQMTLGPQREGRVESTAMFGPGRLKMSCQYHGNQPVLMAWQGETKQIASDDQWHDVTWDADNSARADAIDLRGSANAELVIRSIAFRPSKLKSLFNGKDLTGWKQYTGDPNRMKSKFTVTKEGWLNVQDGSGDLQTESQYADFVFQGECISNGKHLNSGLFFRCLPGQYLQGYEMQIRNEWKNDDRTKPVDFGTGSIYRRQPARKVVSTDGEWFTMTIAAHGRHIATWIDGYQVCDWTDPRPEKDNARKGAKLGKGHFSIQGHDPTTNLSFRNLRVAELKK